MGHKKVYAIDENMCVKEAMTKEEIKADFKLKADFAVQTVLHIVETTSKRTMYISYPDGFNSDNCVVISSMLNIGEGWQTNRKIGITLRKEQGSIRNNTLIRRQ